MTSAADRPIRLFAGVPVGEAGRAAISGALPRPIPGRGVHDENWHLTLHFIGWTPTTALPDLCARLSGIASASAPFHVGLAGVGAFPAPARARVLWVGVEENADRLAALAVETGRRLSIAGYGAAREVDRFHPHLTVARMRPAVSVSAYVERCPEFEVTLQVREIVLFESRAVPGGVRYHALRRFALADPTD